mgnify:CR=1 FL=1
MKAKLRANAPDRILNADAGNGTVSESWAITLPLDRRVAEIERRWGSLDLFLAYAHDDHRERMARVLAKINAAIDDLDNDALRNVTESALKGLARIEATIVERGLEPPDVRYIGQDGLIIAETSEDARRLREHFEGAPRIYTIAEIAMIVVAFETKNAAIPAAKENGGTITAIRKRTPLESELNDALPY